MSIESSYGCKEIQINENDYLRVEKKGEDGYFWQEITFKTRNGEAETFIGLYYTYNYSTSREWMEYNSNFVAILRILTIGYDISDTQVQALFDIQAKKMINGTQKELLEIYNREFKTSKNQLKRNRK